ncbi:uroporphyrinogen-III synthase [Sinimarinibacterium sp. CAU 1509]|uniref:uroporphyrinogen-III synthase n=1 Tax=Sinimarinibacterium sp. CAU 1509 TaxID=2562283 RepID=UPI0010ACD568|nr:uroporphyrinogen-III synthase [Sinimarinibacterium sp. CAU 1509]TJY64691.1 uroporphyrinogen-III synthase [Sinimarinibacterium sp. CAU 1509]
MADGVLSGLSVLVTRPAHQADALCRALEERGARVARLPLQAVEPTRHAAQVARVLQQWRDAQVWIFTSVNAVRFARQLDAGVWPTAAIAVGPATAAALQQLGIDPIVPDSHDSEGVLALPVLQQVRAARILIVTGEGGRDLLQRSLRAHGAEVERAEVYRRVHLPHAPDAVAAALQDIDVALVGNGEALQRLVTLTPEPQRAQLLRLQLVVPSLRVVEQATALGFARPPLVPDQMADSAFVRCLEQWYSTPTDERSS